MVNAVYVMQVNYLGPYHLTRLLEGQLASSAPSRVVNVSSIMHRSGHVDSDPGRFLKDWDKGSQYSNTKLANVLFAYEAQRRLGPKGIQVSLLHQQMPCLLCLHALAERPSTYRVVRMHCTASFVTCITLLILQSLTLL